VFPVLKVMWLHSLIEGLNLYRYRYMSKMFYLSGWNRHTKLGSEGQGWNWLKVISNGRMFFRLLSEFRSISEVFFVSDLVSNSFSCFVACSKSSCMYRWCNLVYDIAFRVLLARSSHSQEQWSYQCERRLRQLWKYIYYHVPRLLLWSPDPV